MRMQQPVDSSLPIAMKWLLLFSLLSFRCSVVLASQALIIIDVQNCFTGNGSLAVKDGEDIIPVINKIREDFGKYFKAVFLTQDWHCVDHVSFASQHPNHSFYDIIELKYLVTGELCESDGFRKSYTTNCTGETVGTKVIEQTLWPDHCIKNTAGAELHKSLKLEATDIVVKKGYHCQTDSYSAFFDNGDFSQTELQSKLNEIGIRTVFLVGLALDYCVYNTAKDAKRLGFTTYIILDATRQISKNTADSAMKDMTSLGVLFLNSSDVGEILKSKVGREFPPCVYLLAFFVLAKSYFSYIF